MLIGNKLDLCQDDQKCRVVSYKTAEELAEVRVCITEISFLLNRLQHENIFLSVQEYGCLYAEASAKSGENVNEAMEILAR